MPKYILNGLSGNVGSLLKHKFNNYSEYNKSLKVTDEKIFVYIAAKSTGKYDEIIDANINYLSEIIKFCKSNKINKIIFFSAISIYTKSDLYSTSKLLGEKMLEESGLNVLVIRLPMILTNDKKNGVLNRIVQKLEKNEDIVLFNADKKFNNFVSIDDIHSFIIRYSFKKKFETIDLGSKKDNTLFDIVQFLKHLLKSKSNILINKQNSPFFNISIKKAEKNSYKPTNTKKKLKNWIIK